MSDATIRASIKTIMDAIPLIGKVHDYERYVHEDSKYIDLFKDDKSKKIYGWMITRESVKISGFTKGKYKWTHPYVIKGVYSLSDADATEKIFQAVIDVILQKFIDNKIPNTQGHSLPQAGSIQIRIFGMALCHYAEIRMEVSEIVPETPEAGLDDWIKLGLNYYLKPGDDIVDASDLITLDE